MDDYTMKYTYQISENVWLDLELKPGTPALLERCSTTELQVSRPIDFDGSKPNYHIPPLTKFLPFKKLTINTYMFILSGRD